MEAQQGASNEASNAEQQSAWYRLRLPDFSPAAIAESGQCFRMFADTEPKSYWLIAHGKLLKIREVASEEYAFSCSVDEFERVWKDYFDLNKNYSEYRAIVPAEDQYLQRAMRYGKGIRILRQEPFEALISFIISQRRSVPAIRTAVAKLSAAFGTPLAPPCTGASEPAAATATACSAAGAPFYAFPTAEQLAAADLEQLAACGLGYRTGFVSACARSVAEGSLDLEGLARISTPDLIAALMELRGVGIKVASCAALFGYHRLDAAPVDVWMARVIQHVYGGEFPPAYAECAGVLQQYLFYYARMERQF